MELHNPSAAGEGSGTVEKFDENAQAAVNAGLDVVTATDWQLFLDLDTAGQQEQFVQLLPKLEEHFKIDDWCATYSKSGNVHVIIALAEPIAESRRIALQAVLGSDPKKEMAAVRRSMDGITNVVRLFRPYPAVSAADLLKRVAAVVNE